MFKMISSFAIQSPVQLFESCSILRLDMMPSALLTADSRMCETRNEDSLTVTNKVFWIVISSDLAVVEEEEVQETLERRITAYNLGKSKV
ncbi:hypothetical protein FRX31_008748 [Thalictrum thalictroides]|uniref:Uncharacterized protein n=1 Tax=Thalictrum thalictroides TaxID=46969 RepID=A0A7J6WW86_THATH|nr:hypothetical protein FRX31_008748 [Thalictrum thalictroides]